MMEAQTEGSIARGSEEKPKTQRAGSLEGGEEFVTHAVKLRLRVYDMGVRGCGLVIAFIDRIAAWKRAVQGVIEWAAHMTVKVSKWAKAGATSAGVNVFSKGFMPRIE